jgi:glycosyltransferase involved in cell wall biosynthesis
MCLNDPSSDPRPMRAIELMKSNGYSVDSVGLPMNQVLLVNQFFEIQIPNDSNLLRILRQLFNLFLRLFSLLIINTNIRDNISDFRSNIIPLRKKFLSKRYDLIIVEDLQLLPLAHKIKNNAKILFDAREYYPRQNEDSLIFRIFERPERVRLCRRYLKRCDSVITVSPGLAAEYSKEFGVSPHVVRSVPIYQSLNPKKTHLNQIRLVHHGIANRNRNLENLINVMNLLDQRFNLDFFLNGDSIYIEELKSYANKNKQICFNDPVPFNDIVPTLNKYDIGFYYLEPRGFNVTFNLPNKLFEFIQARLAVAIGPSPNMAAIVNEYHCGIVAETFSITNMAEEINSLSVTDIDQLKHNSHLAAKELSWEKESMKMEKIINGFNRQPAIS